MEDKLPLNHLHGPKISHPQNTGLVPPPSSGGVEEALVPDRAPHSRGGMTAWVLSEPKGNIPLHETSHSAPVHDNPVLSVPTS